MPETEIEAGEGEVLSMWSTTYLSLDGYEVTIAFSGKDLKAVMAKGKKFLGKLTRAGVVPVRTRPEFPSLHREIGR